MRHARANSSFLFADDLGLSPSISSQFTHLQPKIAKRSLRSPKLVFLGFKVINIDNPKKLVASACYIKQDVCAYLRPFSR